MSETQLSRSVQNILAGMGVLCIRVQSGQANGKHGGHMQLARKGTPDLWFAYHGKQGWLELKDDDGKPSEAQEIWHAEAKEHGVFVAVVRTVQEAVDAVRRMQQIPLITEEP